MRRLAVGRLPESGKRSFSRFISAPIIRAETNWQRTTISIWKRRRGTASVADTVIPAVLSM